LELLLDSLAGTVVGEHFSASGSIRPAWRSPTTFGTF
jgi:hypothetical protein